MSDHVKKLSLYKGRFELEFNEKTHRYKVNGLWKSGVTSMLKRLDKGEGLIQWAANLAVESYANGADKATAKKAWQTFRDDSANTGKEAHKWIERFLIDGTRLTLSPEAEPCVDSFLQWWKGCAPYNIQSERVVFSEKYDYCGTCDIIFNTSIGGRTFRVVADFKTGSPEKEWKQGRNGERGSYTGKSRAYAEAYYQCALYDQAIYEEDGVWADMYMIIYLTKEGMLYTYFTEAVSEYHKAAILAVQLCQAEKELKVVHEYKNELQLW